MRPVLLALLSAAAAALAEQQAAQPPELESVLRIFYAKYGAAAHAGRGGLIEQLVAKHTAAPERLYTKLRKKCQTHQRSLHSSASDSSPFCPQLGAHCCCLPETADRQ